MKKLKLIPVFLMLLAVMALTCSCTGISIPGLTTQTCTVHRDLNRDTVCDVCGNYVPVNCVNHMDANHDGACDTKGCTATFRVYHYDENHDGKCDEPLCTKTGIRVVHEDDDFDRKCDICGGKMASDCECYDDDEDGYCDDCGYEILPCEHVDEDEDGYCDECDEELKVECDECVDENADGKCDVCGGDVELPAECEHTDDNFDGKCDLCKAKMENSIPIYENGKMNFTMVLAAGAPMNNAMIFDQLIAELQGYQLEVTRGEDVANKATEYEIYFGAPTQRDEMYQVDRHVYGMKGYSVQLIGTKIIIVSGSDKTFEEAVAAFKETFLGITSSTRKLTSRYISEKNNISEIQDDYDVSTITLLGNDIKGFTIAADKTDTAAYPVEVALQEMLYARTGYWLDIVPVAEADKSIVIKMQPKNVENEGFYATFTDGKMEFISEYPTVIQNKVINFFTLGLAQSKTSGTFAIEEKDSFTDDVRYVYYKDFGVVGDGETDDSEAIRAAHEYANRGGHKVFAHDSKTYYIGKMASSIPIRTDVDWRNSKFILDDTVVPPTEVNERGETVSFRGIEIFSIGRGTFDYKAPEAWSAKIKELNANGGIHAASFTSFEVELGRPLLLCVYNSTHKDYIRNGVNANGGGNQNEMILVDEHGNLDPSTPFMFDFEYISSVSIYSVQDTPITVEGGTFITRPYLQQTETSYLSYERGINVSRSNVTVKNVKHILENEGAYNQSDHRYKGESVDYGFPYGGFYGTNKAYNVLFKDCQMSSRKTYWQTKGAGMGTYDYSPGDSVKVTCDGCYQDDDNFFSRDDADGIPTNRWGVMGSSGCKNVTFLNSKLSRFDAHAGIYNAYIINTEIRMVRVVGAGTFKMEGCTYHGGGLQLREDYGGFWHGTMILKNNDIIGGSVTLITNSYWVDHNFGYRTAYPSRIIIDGIKVYKDREKTQLHDTAVITAIGGAVANADYKSTAEYFPKNITDAGGNTVPDTYSDGTPVMTYNKNPIPNIEKIIIRNCNALLPDLQSVPWLADTIVENNVNTGCVEHIDFDRDMLCDDCGEDFTPCTEHIDLNGDTRCSLCWGYAERDCDRHIDKNSNGKCDLCYRPYHCPAHRDDNGDHFCDVCRATMCYEEHRDYDADCVCDICKVKIACVDADSNKKCDVCTLSISKCKTCVDVWPMDSKCDKCGKEIAKCGSCTDADSDGWCDTCHRNMTTEAPRCYLCKDADGNQVCDICGAEVLPLNCEHVDVYNVDGSCDFCGLALSEEPACEHADAEPQDNVCDLCGEEIPVNAE